MPVIDVISNLVKLVFLIIVPGILLNLVFLRKIENTIEFILFSTVPFFIIQSLLVFVLNTLLDVDITLVTVSVISAAVIILCIIVGKMSEHDLNTRTRTHIKILRDVFIRTSRMQMLVLFFCIVNIAVSLCLLDVPIYSDSALRQSTIRQLVFEQKVPESHNLIFSWYSFPKIGKMPLYYPALYYVTGGISWIMLGEVGPRFLAITACTATLLGLFLLFRELFDETIATVTATLASGVTFCIFPDEDSLLILFTLLTVYAYVVYIKRGSNVNMILTALFAAATLGCKTNGVFFLLPILIHGIILTNKRKKIFWIALLTMLLYLPVLYYQIETTGTVTYFGIGGAENILDKRIFHPKFLEWSDAEKVLNEKINFEQIYSEATEGYCSAFHPFSPLIDPVKTIGCMKFNFDFNIFIDFLFFAGIIMFHINILKEWSSKQSKLLLLFLTYEILLLILLQFITANPAYLIAFPYIFSHFFAIGALALCEFLEKKKLLKRNMIISILLLLLAGSVILQTERSFTYIKEFPKNHIMSRYSPGGINSVILLSNWIKNNTDPNDRFFTADVEDFPLYMGRVALWDFRLFYLTSEEDVLHYLKMYEITYVIIWKEQIVNEQKYAEEVPANCVFLRLVQDSTYFKLIKKVNHLYLYKFLSSD